MKNLDWKTAWSYLPVNYNTCIATFCNTTQRTFFRNNLNGTKIKIKFSNLYSKKPLILDQVAIGKKDKTKTEIEGIQYVTSHGNEKIVIEPGQEFYSDEIDFSLCVTNDMVLSIYVKEQTEIYSVCSTWAAESWHTRYGLNGNFVKEQEFSETDSFDAYPVLQTDPNKANYLFGVSEIKVYTDSAVKTVALFGDSITHMSYYSDALIEKLYQSHPGEITVVNRALGGNRLLHDASCIPEFVGDGMLFGDAGIKRFYHDTYDCDQPEFVMLLIGVNDFMHPYQFKHYDEVVTVEEYQKGIMQLFQIAHENGSKIFMGTVMPFKHEETDWFVQADELRTKANEWIRKQKIADGIMDFDVAVRTAEAPEYMLEAYHLGDGLHPNTIGGKKMADLVPMEWFK